MSFDAFNRWEIDQYAEEVKQRWQKTDAYREYQTKTKAYTADDWKKANSRLSEQFKRFSRLVGTAANNPAVQNEAENLKLVITEEYYTCTDEILASLAEMYVDDERFRRSINEFGEGTAELIREAVRIYCRNQ